MAEHRNRKTGQHDVAVARAQADATAAKKAVAELTQRVERLEAELSALRVERPSAIAPRPTPGRPKPPPLPGPLPGRTTHGGAKSVIDISELAEDVQDSIPPPAPRRPKQ